MITKQAEFKGFDDAIDIQGREFYDYYRKHRKKSVPWLKDHTLFKRAIGAMFEVISDKLVEVDGGVYLEGIGYFGVLMSPKKKKKAMSVFNPNKNDYSAIKKQYKYTPYFFGNIGYGYFKDWTMSMSFDAHYLKRIRKSKVKYKLYYTALQQLWKANKQTKMNKHKENANNKTDN